MDIEELREYNLMVIRASKEVSKPYKITTLVLSVLLVLMMCLYFFCPTDVVVEQNFDGKNSILTTNNQEG